MPIDISTIAASHESVARDARDYMRTLDAHLGPSLSRTLREQAAIARQAQLLDLRSLAGLADVTAAEAAFESVNTFVPHATATQLVASALESARAFDRGSAVELALSQRDALQRFQDDSTMSLAHSGFHETIAQFHEAAAGLRGAIEALEAVAALTGGAARWQVLPDSIQPWRTFLPEDVRAWLEGDDEDFDGDVELNERGDVSSEPVATEDDTRSIDALEYTEIMVACEAARVRLRTLARRFSLIPFGDDAMLGADSDHVVAVSEGVPALAAAIATTAGPFMRHYRLLYATCGATRGGVEAMALIDLQALALATQEFDGVLRRVERWLDS